MIKIRHYIIAVIALCIPSLSFAGPTDHSVARQWNEVLLEAIRNDFARPTVHARNLFHTSIAIYDAWAVYDDTATPYLLNEEPPEVDDIDAAREETMSYACYHILRARFAESPGKDETLPNIDAKMTELGFSTTDFSTIGKTPKALGNRLAILIQAYGLNDGANEQAEYEPNNGYESVNFPMAVELGGTTDVNDPNRWQPLSLEFFVDQANNPIPITEQSFLGPHWGQLPPFAMTAANEGPPNVWFDPGTPPQLKTDSNQATMEEDLEYREMFTSVAVFQSYMDPDLPETIDISPGVTGNNTLGTEDGTGHPINPVTQMPYESNVVKLGDWSRCLAEFWADGPDSETPPGHWNTIANYVSDNLETYQISGEGPSVNRLEWDSKLYLALNGATYDSAVAAWGIKGYYDYVRPITAIRYMAEQGQSSDPNGPSYDPQGIILVPGIVEVITIDTILPGQRHEHLSAHVGEIAIRAWPGVPENPETETQGVEWLLATNWVPYQRDTFVTPPFAGYVSGHSTFSRSAAEILTEITGSMYFPGGLGEFVCPANEFLVFEDGPSETVVLQWATYYDASDESGISRLWGGIHPRADDFPGRIIGSQVGKTAWNRAVNFFNGTADTLDTDSWLIF